jgi:hypothetical protein
VSVVELGPVGELRVLREHLAAAGLPTDDATVVAFANRLGAAHAQREARVDALHTVFGVPAALRGDAQHP